MHGIPLSALNDRETPFALSIKELRREEMQLIYRGFIVKVVNYMV
jgi:hypothetical protein